MSRDVQLRRQDQYQLPPVWVRLTRDRLVLAALVVITSLALVSGQLTEGARLQLEASIDSHWRGAYDLLVVPKGSNLLADRTAGIVEPNFLGYASSGSISLDQLAAIRAVAGVDVAAPIGVVGYVRSQVVAPNYVVTRLPAQPTLYHLALTLSDSDGLHEIVLNRQEADLLVGPPQASGPNWIDTNSSGSGGNGDPIRSSFAAPPELRTEVIAVDPTAEAALLGSQANALDALKQPFFRGSLSAPYFDCTLDKAALALLGVSGCEAQPSSAPLVPVLVSRDLYTPVTLRLDVSQVGHPLAKMPALNGQTDDVIQQAKLDAGAGSTPIGSTTRDVSGEILPFTGAGDLSILFPGDPPPTDQGSFQNASEFVEAYVPNRPSYQIRTARPGSNVPTFEVRSIGPVTAGGDPITPSASESSGLEGGYRTLVRVPLQAAHAGSAGPPDDITVEAIGDGFRASDLLPASDPLNYVPFGAYDPPQSQLVAGPSGEAVSPVAIHPTLNPAGFIDTPPLAITDLLGGTLLRGRTPIDAVRVRVAGLGSFDARAEATLEDVANRIRSIGLDVDIVAGSSPQSVELYVPSYFVDSEPPRDLGYVHQQWTTLGAAQHVSTGLSDADLLLLAAALCVAWVLAAGVELVRAVTRARDVAVLRSAGWGPRQILGWLTLDGILAGALVAGAAVLAWTGGHSAIALAAGLGLAITMPVGTLLGAVLASRARAPGARQSGDVWLDLPLVRQLPATGPVSIGLRSALIRPIRTIVIGTALALAAAALSLGLLVLGGAAQRAGATQLGVALSTELRPSQLGLLLLTVAGGFLAAFLLLRLDAADRAVESAVLRAAGWSPRQIAWSGHSYRLVLALISGAGAAGISAAAAAPVALSDGSSAAALAAVAAASVLVWGGLTAATQSAGAVERRHRG